MRFGGFTLGLRSNFYDTQPTPKNPNLDLLKVVDRNNDIPQMVVLIARNPMVERKQTEKRTQANI